MKRLFLFVGVALGWVALGVVSVRAQGGTGSVMREARVTQLVKDVKLLSGQTEPRPATLSDTVRGDTAVRTGAESRAELTFGDLTIARLGANTIFSFNQGSRTVELGNGAILLRVPKGSGGAKVQTAAVTAAITGTTVIVEYHPKSYAKYLVLEGSMRIYLKGILGESVLMGPGQMMILNPNTKRLSEAVDFDLDRLWKTSLLIQGFRPLGSEPLMAEVKQTQLEKKAAGELIDTNLVIFGRGTLVTMTDPQSTDVIDRKTAAVTLPTPAPRASATPSKIGRPPVIANSVGYQIAGASVIQTDPSVTTPGRTDFGKNYRGPGADANFSIWSFDTTRPFDTASGFDAFYTGAGVPIAAFKFQSLVLAGNPTISTANGGATFLELIGVDGITSGPPGGTLTFAGIDNLLLAAQNGSILLGPEISFQNIPALFLYARGTGSNIVLGSPISGTRDLFLEAEGSVQVNGNENITNFRSVTGTDFLAGTGAITAQSVLINSQRDLNFSSRQFPVNLANRNTLSLSGGANVNIDVADFAPVFANALTVNVTGAAINITSTSPNQFGFATLDVGNSNATFTAGAGGIQGPNVVLESLPHKLAITSQGNINLWGVVDANLLQSIAGNIAARDVLQADTISAAGSIATVQRDIIGFNSITAGTTINAAGRLISPLVTAGGNITADTVKVETINAPNGILTAGNGGIVPLTGPGAQHQFTINSIVSPNGINFSGDYYVANLAAPPQPGGKLSINATTLTLNGAANFSGSSGAPANSAGSSGGQFTINTTGAITLNAPIQATTGSNAAGVAFGGTGGTVSFTSTAGTVNVNSSILVSSNDPNGPGPLRRSAAGGTLSLNSGLTSGNAITLGAGAQLFSLLNANASGPGGQITISSAGGNIIDNGATIQADRGTITIQHTAAASFGTAQITLDGGTISSETLLVSSRGDLSVGATTPVNLSAVTLSFLATRNLVWGGGTLTATASASSGNVTFQSGNDITITNAFNIQRFNGGITDGLNLFLFAGRNFQANSGLTLGTDGSGLTSGGNITLQSGAAMNIGGIALLQTRLTTADQGSGSNITIGAVGPITVSDLFASVAIGAGRTLSNGGVITVTGKSSYTATLGNGGLNLQVANSSPGVIGTGGNISLALEGSLTTGTSGALNLVINNSNGGRIQTGGNITATISTGLTANSVNVQIDNRFKGFIGTGAGITFAAGGTFTTKSDANFEILNSQRGTTGGTIVSDAFVKVTLADANIGNNLNAFIDNSDGAIGGVGGTVTLQVNGKLTVSGRIDVFGTLTSTGSIMAGQLSGTTVNAPGIDVGGGGITRFTFPNEITVNPLHTITTNALTSTGGINFNGPDLDTPPGTGPFDGGQLTINVPSLTFGPSAADNIQGPVTFNGGNSFTNPIPAGSGGTFNVNATGAITVSSPIQATTGLLPDASEPSGNGGTVNLNSTGGTISVNSAITVSSADASTAPPSPRRKSRSGGNINLKSDAPTGVAINVNNTGQLLSLLDAAAPGAGGKITILATGANSRIQIAGAPPKDTIRADKAGGFVDIRHTGAAGTITMTNATISADIVKVGALGSNGNLTIGGGRIDANTVLKLYATGANGSLIFVSNVVLNLNSTNLLDRIIIAGNSVTVNTGVVVAIGSPAGLSRTADIYVPNLAGANYSALEGGNNTTNGRFIIDGTQGSPVSGAVTHIAPPPAFGPPGGP